MTVRRLGLVLAVAAVLLRLVFWRHTGRVWEDSLITLLHAENAVAGLGLTHFKPDEPPIHGFTSPLGVLVPLLGEWLRAGWALEAMRVASLAAAFASVVVASRIAEILRLGLPTAALALGYIAFEHHQVLWGMTGLETQLVVFVVLLSFLFAVQRRPVALGLALGACMLARPDLGLWAVVVGAWMLAHAWRTRDAKPLATTVAVAFAVWLPWVLFAWAYYGSPIPNTVLAKAAGWELWWKRSSGLAFWAGGAWYQAWVSLLAPLGPTFGGHGTGFVRLWDPGVLAGILSAAIAGSLVVALVRREASALLLHGYFWTYLLYNIFLVPLTFGWYVVPLMAVAVLLAAHGLGALWAHLGTMGARLAWGFTAAYLAVMVGVLPVTFHGERNVMRMEEQVRIALGRYLREHASAGATIGGEPLGFIGYHSRRAYYDYPGLASRRVVDFVRSSGKRGLFPMLQHVRPDYIVLRDIELEALGGQRAWLEQHYVVARRFEVPPSDRARLLHPERNIDLAFTLFRRRDGG